MAMLMLVSRNIKAIRPNTIAVDTAMPNEPALGSRHITNTATNAPMNRYGMRRPKRHHVLSLNVPTSGCTMMPISGGRIQK